MIRSNRTLSAFRDIVIIFGMLLLCALSLQDFGARFQARRDQQARFALVTTALQQLDAFYKQQSSSTTDINQVVLRQNQMLLDYQKLQLTAEFLPATALRRQQPVSKPPETKQP